mmetsp:Transcript_35426/g.79934  ORF Transcript_35426/g.79934 Transcript_35426/m.79934 type:complete len:380 (+) Transcript_35426:76-1215(+)
MWKRPLYLICGNLLLSWTPCLVAGALSLPPCDKLATDDGSSCIEDGVHLWGIDDGAQLIENSIHDAASVEGKPVRVGIRVNMEVLLVGGGNLLPIATGCENCSKYAPVFMDTTPETAIRQMFPALFQGSLPGGWSVDMDKLSQIVEDFQLHQLISVANRLHIYLETQGVNLKSVEGGTVNFVEKLRLMRRLVLAPGVNTVCEVGFNAGSSTLLWLTAGARRVHSFELGQYPYSSIAISWLAKRFPGRFDVTMGDSLETVATFHKLWPTERCDLLFVDGGHLYEHVYGDLKNLQHLARGAESIVLADDTNQEPVLRAWKDFIAQGLATEIEAVQAPYLSAFISPICDDFTWGCQSSFLGEENAAIPSWDSAMSYGRLLLG